MQLLHQPLQAQIVDAIHLANHNIQIAICWFTHPGIYTALSRQLDNGIKVELLLNYDQLNFRPDGLDFHALATKGCNTKALVDQNLMHHKFMLIDHTTAYYGTFNWTHSLNFDAILKSTERSFVQQLRVTFDDLFKRAKPLFQLKDQQPKMVTIASLYQSLPWAFSDLRKMVLHNKKIWLYKTDCRALFNWSFCIENDLLGLQVEHQQGYNARNILKQINHKPQLKLAKTLAEKMERHDIIAACSKGHIIAIGIISSGIEYDSNMGIYRTCSWKSLPQSIELHTRCTNIQLWRGSNFWLVDQVDAL